LTHLQHNLPAMDLHVHFFDMHVNRNGQSDQVSCASGSANLSENMQCKQLYLQ
jgi:hypothetical protein